MSLFATISAQAAKAKQAAVYLRQLDTTAKNQALSAMAGRARFLMEADRGTRRSWRLRTKSAPRALFSS